jgi:phosphoribosylformimino-5-aminoimidazole carboxamide ribotide isomerase
MQLYPAIDLRHGRVVRLVQGDFAQETRYATDALELAKVYEQQGANWLHVVDLDGAKGDAAASQGNMRIIENIARSTRMAVQTGGGVRTEADVRARLDAGAKRIVVGSLAIRAPDTVISWLALFGPAHLALALDAKADASGTFWVHTAGWQEAAHTELFACAQRFERAGFHHALVTDIARDGMLAGPNIALYQALSAALSTLSVQASGGVANLADLTALRANAAGVIIGKALLEGKFTLTQAHELLAGTSVAAP